ncbi:CHAT domain-containing protein [Actinoplanes sp. Pm04-4]|uniref:CHAT domain-containing protein n=1 Tax=Paractinoplanes pyxinae TaxID=2997416 RepID=A0ABT4BHK7_9ACTN|nr:CHAT domain-containing tetratricopeptide repeat protein [Actinoplanes pyxinae]MCY1145080.1 CHAT domain-containing protein [Actinoplanes pyxinae]
MTQLEGRAGRLYAAGVEASEDGRPALAVRRLRAALRLVASDPVRGRVLVTLAWAESERGRVDLGFRLLDEAEPLLPPPDRAVLHAQRAVLLHRNGRVERALPEFDQAIAGLSAAGEPLDLIKALNNRSLVHLDAGRVAAARADLQHALRLARACEMAFAVALLTVNLGYLDVVAGDLPAALGGFASARSTYEEMAPGRLPALAIERARALVAAGLFREADRELGSAVEQARAQGQEHTVADALQVRAEAALLAGRTESAAAWADECRVLFVRRGNRRRAALAALVVLRAGPPDVRTARRLAASLRKLGLEEDARVADLVAGSVAPGRRLDRLDTRLLRRLTRAELARAAGKPADADRELAAGMATLQRHRARFGCLDLQTGASAHGRDLAAAGLAAALESGSPSAVHRWSERSRAQALLLPAVRPPDDPTAAAYLEDLRQTRYALRAAQLEGRATSALRGRVEALERRVRESAWSMRGVEGSAQAPAPLGSVQGRLGDETALVAYLRSGGVLRALVVTRARAIVVRLGEWAAAEEAVLRLRADLDTSAGRALPSRMAAAVAATTRHDAEALQRAVLDPIASLVGDRALVVVPTGVLMTAPWALLPFCAGRPVTVAPSATTWVAAARTRRPGPVALVAGPGNQRGEAEIADIANLYPGATVLAGDTAATLTALDGAGLAHIAAHGRHEAENALFSALDLHGGPLLGYDLQRLQSPPPLVVLSSCELGLTEVRPGDETFGLASALLAAGTATVVASVARVADGAAHDAMVSFHRALAAGQEPATALAGAAAGTGFVCLGA